MKIIKKNGRIEDFDKNKLHTSIDNASRDIKEMSLNESDIRLLVEDVTKEILKIRKDGSPSSSYEIIGVLTEVLMKDGFGAILKSFIEH